MGVRTARPRMAFSISTYILKCGGPPADSGHPGSRRTGGHPGGRRTGGRYTTGGHTCLRYGRREDTEGAPTWRHEKMYQPKRYTVHLYSQREFSNGNFSFLVSEPGGRIILRCKKKLGPLPSGAFSRRARWVWL